MIILGLDPGIGRTGWGIIKKKGNSHKAIDFGCIETTPNSPINQRLHILFQDVQKIINKYSPDLVVVEELFFNTNAKTALIVGQARGVTLLACEISGCTTVSYTPLQIKMSLAGYGRADKSQVGQMVKSLLNLKKIPKPDDTSDALAAALTGAFSHKMEIIKKNDSI